MPCSRRLGTVLVAAALVGAACTASTSTDDAGDAPRTSIAPPSAPEGGDGDAPGPGDPGPGDPGLGDLTRVTGTAEAADLTGALEAPVTLPLVLTVPSAGGGNGAVITGIEASGGDTVVWDGGRPITLAGDGTVAIQPGSFRVGPDGLFADLSEAAHPLSAGSYSVSGPVAVGDSGGLAAPSTQTTFTAGPGAVLSGTGTVEGRLPAGTWLLLGPGAVSLSGALTVDTSESSTTVTSATMAAGSFEVTFTVADDGTVTVEALLDGDVVTT